MRASVIVCLGALLLCIAAPVPGTAAGDGSAETPYHVPHFDGSIRVDGVLDDPAWERALALELAYETHPGENITPPLVETDLLLMTSSTHLYAAFRCFDPDPAEICANITDRDRMYDDDRVSLILDTYNDQRRSYMFFCNPYGIQGDALDSRGLGAGEATWDTIWDSEGRITDDGWIVEMAIPFSSLRFQRTDGEQTWGVGAGRKYSRDVDYRFSLNERDRDNTCYLCQVIKVRGFEGATPGRNIELDPTASWLASAMRSPDPDGGFDPDGEMEWQEGEFDLGLTARWGITPNLVLSGAVNPDFSQIEADAFQLDINERYALYYEEKRPFFLEGMEFFNSRLNLVYTRSVANPLWGLKLTGKEGGNAIGAFVAHDESPNLLLASSQWSFPIALDDEITSSVVRYRRDIGETSTVGVMATGRSGEDYSNYVGGVDASLRFGPSDVLEFQALGSRTEYPAGVGWRSYEEDGEFDGTAYDVEYNHDASDWDWWLAYREIGSRFRSDVGYLPRVGYRQARTGWVREWRREAGHWYSYLNGGFGYVHEEERNGDLLRSFLDWWSHYEGPSRVSVNLYGMIGTERFDGVDYDQIEYYTNVSWWPTGSLFLATDVDFGDAVDYRHGREATFLSIEPYVQYKIGRRLDLALVHEYVRLSADEGRLFSANVSFLRGTYQFTRRAFLRAILQYETTDVDEEIYDAIDEDTLATQILFSYKINPQTVFYVGYSDSHYGTDEFCLTQSDRTVFAKIGYAWVM
jgi:hypothetical protein